MRTTTEGQELITGEEGCALVAYLDGGGVPTIGYGHTAGVRLGDTCSQDQANAWFLEDLAGIESALSAFLEPVNVTDNQFSALASFCFNEGFGRKGVKDGFRWLASGEPSTLYKCLMAADFQGAAAEFPKWHRIGNVESAGLLTRRLAEQSLFNKGA